MTNSKKMIFANQKHPFLWISVFSLIIAYILIQLNIYLGSQVNYLDYLSLFNGLTVAVLTFVVIAVAISLAGLWRARFKSIPLLVMSLISSAFLLLLFLID